MWHTNLLRVVFIAWLPGIGGLAVVSGCESPSGQDGPDASADTGADTGDSDVGSRDFHEQVPMRDGVRLDTRVVLPSLGSGPWPALLLRSPYLREGSDAVVPYLSGFTDEGYALVVQAVRGTATSEGTLHPLAQEFPDGHDTVDWLIAQPWSNGRVGTFGASYEGFTAGAAAVESPEVDVVVMDGAITRAFEGWPGQRGIGVSYGMLMWWTWVEGLDDAGQDPEFYDVVTNVRPERDHDIAYFGEEVDVWREVVPHLDRSSEFWDERSLVGRIGQLCIPALHLQAAQEWADDPLAAFLDSQGDACTAEQRATQRFVLGSHVHGSALYDPFADTPPSTLLRMYFDRYLKDAPVDIEAVPRVQYYLTGADEWGEGSTWPPGEASVDFYLATPEELVSSEPPAGAVELAIDPDNDDPCASDYSKYLTFLSAPLDADIDLVGRAEVHLSVEIDTPDADLFVNLWTVSPANEYGWVHGSRMRLRYRDSYEAPAPMTPGMEEEVSIELPAVAMRLPAGYRLALYISGAECGTPENPHTGGSIADETEVLPAVIRIHTGGAEPSLVRLPVVGAR